jgi:beta-N-acetylhexosaminidase
MLAAGPALLLVAVVAAWVFGPQPAASPIPIPIPAPAETPIAQASPTAAPWNLDDDVGALMVLSWKSATPWSVVRGELVNDHAGGVLLFSSNFGGTPQGLSQMTSRLNALASTTCQSHPILSMLDQEGGDVINVRAPFAPPWPVVMAGGGTAHVHDLEAASGAGLRAAGLDLDLAPVADVRTNAYDLTIGGRSFGSNPSVVAPLVSAAVKGLHDGGVGATLKHFPGLGGAAGDPHVAVPTDTESEAQWEAVQLPGFRAGVSAGVDAVMVTAMYAPGLGVTTVPALFSHSITNRIRTQLGFDGVIVTDSLSMGGIGVRWSLAQAAVLAVAAGNDMILLGNADPAYEAAAIAAVKVAVRSGRISWAQVHRSAQRVNALRDRWGPRPTSCVRHL